jgi:hypothetical protein
MNQSRYLRLFGDAGRALSDRDWIERANQCLPDNFAAINARYLDGSTLSLTVTIMRAEKAPTYTATGRVLKLTRATGVLAAALEDEAGETVATATVVSQLITDLGSPLARDDRRPPGLGARGL